MEYFYSYIRPELLVLIPVLYIIGMALSKSERVENKFIPLVLGGVSIFLAMIYMLSVVRLVSLRCFFTAVFTGTTQGVICAGASVYINQIIKQWYK